MKDFEETFNRSFAFGCYVIENDQEKSPETKLSRLSPTK